MKYFKYWKYQGASHHVDESDCMFVAAESQDEATLITERKWDRTAHLKVREIQPVDLPGGEAWQS